VLRLLRIVAPSFTAAIFLDRDDRASRSAPILGYMVRGQWTEDHIRVYAKNQGWTIEEPGGD